MDDLPGEMRALREEMHSLAISLAKMESLVQRIERIETDVDRVKDLTAKIAGGISLVVAVVSAAVKALWDKS